MVTNNTLRAVPFVGYCAINCNCWLRKCIALRGANDGYGVVAWMQKMGDVVAFGFDTQ